MAHLFQIQGIRGRGMSLLGMGPWIGGANPLVVGLQTQPTPAVPTLPLPLLLKMPWYGPRLSSMGKAKVKPGTQPTRLLISGVTRDSNSAVLGSCTVKLYRTTDDVLLETLTSDATTGAYAFSACSASFTYYVVAYKAGSPDVAGTTVNTLVGS